MCALCPALFSHHMDDFIRAVKQVEDEDPEAGPVAVLKKVRRAARLDDALTQRFLGEVDSSGAAMEAGLSDYIRKAVQHRVTDDGKEKGVVLTSDGTSVALEPLLLGIEAGLLSKAGGRVRGLYQLTLTNDLSSSLTHSSPVTKHSGADGCWDSLTSPHIFTLSDTPTLLTTAQVNGAMDGVVIGMEVSDRSRRPLKLSTLLTEYYCHQLDRDGLDAAPRLISRRRRENFRGLIVPPVLLRKVMKSVELHHKTMGQSKKERKQLMATVKEGMRAFVHMFMGELTSNETRNDPTTQYPFLNSSHM